MKRNLIMVLFLGMTFLSWGCSSSKDKGKTDTGIGTDHGLSDIQGDTKTGDIQQPPQDIPPEGQTQTRCETEADCQALGKDFHCNINGFCIEGDCAEDKNCGSANYCDPRTKTCESRKEACGACTGDYQCTQDPASVCHGLPAEGGFTAQTFCLQKCTPNGRCMGTTKYRCQDVGEQDYWLCVPMSGTCGQLEQCKKDEDCEFGKICNPLTHMCTDAQCENDLECGYPDTGKVCAMGRCIEACTEENGVVKGCDQPKPDWASDRPWICEDGHCKIEGACFSPNDCMEKETYCDSETHKCVPGCKIDFDCKDAGKVCLNGHCVDKGCTHNYECSFGQVCDKATGKCEDAPELFCKACQPSQQDKSGDCGDKDTICLTLKDKDGNEKGSFCFPPCDGDPKGVDSCPQGYQCVEIKEQDQNGNVKNTYHQCVRDCTANQPNEGDVDHGEIDKGE